ncbi:MAG: hypothetical protein R3E83_04700 [Burkholderiaceae bacterium]
MPLTSNGFPVMLTFDLDAETMWTARDANNRQRPVVLSQGAYGWKVGMPRILGCSIATESRPPSSCQAR